VSLGWNPTLITTGAIGKADQRFSFLTDRVDEWVRNADDFVTEIAALSDALGDTARTFADGELPEFDLSDLPELELDDLPDPLEIEDLLSDLDTAPGKPSLLETRYRGPTGFTGSAPRAPAIRTLTPPDAEAKNTATPPSPADLDAGKAPDLNDYSLYDPGQAPDLDFDIRLPAPIAVLFPDAPDEPTLSGRPVAPSNNYVQDALASTVQIFNTITAQVEASETAQGIRDAGGHKAIVRVGEMLEGGTGLPAAVEQALFDRAVSREQKTSERTIDQATGEWARRGFAMPGSTLLLRIAEARQVNREAQCELNRDTMIQMHTEELQNLRLAVQQGIQLQAQMFDQSSRVYELGQSIAQSALDASFRIFEAQVSLLELDVRVYQSLVSAYGERIRAESARIDAYRAEIEAAIAQGRLEETRASIFRAKVDLRLATLQEFTSAVQAYRANVESKGLILERYRTQIEAFGQEVRADAAKADIFGVQVANETAQAEQYRAQVQGFAAEVDAFRQEVEAATSIANVEQQTDRNRIEIYQAEVAAWGEKVRTRLSEQTAKIENLRANLERLRLQSSNEQAILNSKLQQQELQVRVDETKARLLVSDNQLALQQLADRVRLAQTQITAVADVYSQLAASAMSAINVSASISDSASSQSSHSSSYSENRRVE